MYDEDLIKREWGIKDTVYHNNVYIEYYHDEEDAIFKGDVNKRYIRRLKGRKCEVNSSRAKP